MWATACGSVSAMLGLLPELSTRQPVTSAAVTLTEDVEGALDIKNAKIADMDQRIRSLQHTARRLQPKRQAKVVPANPNERFVSIGDIKEVKEKVATQQKQKGVVIDDIATYNEILDGKLCRIL